MTEQRVGKLEDQVGELRPLVAAHEVRIDTMSTVMNKLEESHITTNEKMTNAIEIMTACDAAQDVRHAKVTSQVTNALRIAIWLAGIAGTIFTGYVISRF